MSSRRQSMRVSSQSSSSVTVTKTSFSSFSSSTSISSPSSSKRKGNRFSIDSFTGMASPDWISGSEVVFKTPELPESTRRSTIHVQRKRGNDLDFKIPSLMFSSPPGVKTRSRRSSMYVSSQQRKSSPKLKAQKKDQTAVKRAGKAKQGKKVTRITPVKVSLTDDSHLLNSSSIDNTNKGVKSKGKAMSKVKTPPTRSSRVRKSSSTSGAKLGKSSPPKSSARASSNKREARSTASGATSPVKMTAIKESATIVSSSAEERSPQSGKKTTPKGKKSESLSPKRGNVQIVRSPPSMSKSKQTRSTKTSPVKMTAIKGSVTKVSSSSEGSSKQSGKKTTPKGNKSVSSSPKRENIQIVRSPPSMSKSKQTRSTKRGSSRRAETVSPVSERKLASQGNSPVASPESIPSKQARSRSRSTRQQRDSSQGSSAKASMTTLIKESPDQQTKTKTSSLKANTVKRTPGKSSPRNTPALKKHSSSRRTSTRKAKMTLQVEEVQESSPETPAKQSKAKGKSQKPSKHANQSLSSTETPKTRSRKSTKKTPHTKTEITKSSPPSQQMKQSPLKAKTKSPAVTSQIRKEVSIKRTPSRREHVRIMSSQKKSASSSRSVKKSSAAKTSVASVAKLDLNVTPKKAVTSRPARAVTLTVALERINDKNKGRKSFTGGISSPSRNKSFQSTSQFSSYDSPSKIPSPREAVTKMVTTSVSRDFSFKGSKIGDLNITKLTSKSTPDTLSLKTVTQGKSAPVSSRKSLSSARVSGRLVHLDKPALNLDFGKSIRRSEEKSVDMRQSSSPPSLKKRKFETEAEEIDRMVNTMVQASLPKKRKSPSPSRYVERASPARTTLFKKTEATVSSVTSMTGRKSLRGLHNINITPSAAAPKARKILGVYDSPSRDVEVSQKYSFSRKSGSTSVGQYEMFGTRNVGRSLIGTRDDDDDNDSESIESSEHILQESVSVTTGTGTEQEEEMSMQETGSSVEDDEASATEYGTSAEDETSVPDDEEEMSDESDEDIENDSNITLSHTSHSQRCTIS